MLAILTEGCQVQIRVVPTRNGSNTSFEVLLVDSGGQLGLPTEYPTDEVVLLVLSPSMRLVPYSEK